METRTLTKDGKSITYLLSRRRTGRITVRVSPEGTVRVCAPPRAPLYEIAGVMEKHFDKILAAVADSTPARPMAEGATVFYLGEAYRLCVVRGKCALTFREGVATLFLPTEQTDLSAAYERAARPLVLALITARCLAFEAAHPALGERRRQIRVRKMRSVWGNCRPERGILTFSTELLRFPLPLIDGVIAHEYAHLLHRGHGADFYETLTALSPDHRELKRALEAQKQAQRKEMAK